MTENVHPGDWERALYVGMRDGKIGPSEYAREMNERRGGRRDHQAHASSPPPAAAVPAAPAATAPRKVPGGATDALAYFEARNQLAADIRAGLVRTTGADLCHRMAVGAGVEVHVAAEWTERFLSDLQRHLDRARGRP